MQRQGLAVYLPQRHSVVRVSASCSLCSPGLRLPVRPPRASPSTKGAWYSPRKQREGNQSSKVVHGRVNLWLFGSVTGR